ncbi:outer membrane protein assembly factor BamB family protein [Haloarchaeobius iranensis]
MNTSPVVENGLVYIGGSGDPGLVHAIELRSGEQQWEFEPAGYLSSAPALVDGTLYFGTWGKQFYALDAESGDVLWNTEVGHRFGSSSPAVVDGSVYVGSYGDGPLVVSGSEDEEEFEAPAMFALDTESGEIQWRYDQFGDRSQIGSSPAVADGRVYFGAEETLYALDSEAGDEVWTRNVPSHPDSSPAVVDGTVYYGGPTLSDSGPPAQLTALDAASGDTNWTADLDDISFRSSPAVADGTVYVAASSRRVCTGAGGDGESECSGTTRGQVYAIDSESGERQWTAEIKTDTRSSPAVVDNVVFVGCRDGLSAVTTDGENAWRINFEDDREDGPYVDSSPAVADGHVFIGASDGQLRGINADSR